MKTIDDFASALCKEWAHRCEDGRPSFDSVRSIAALEHTLVEDFGLTDREARSFVLELAGQKG
jgi:hypothetical protein